MLITWNKYKFQKRVSERLLFNTSSAFFKQYLSKNKLTVNEMIDDEVCFILDQHAELGFYSASSLKQ